MAYLFNESSYAICQRQECKPLWCCYEYSFSQNEPRAPLALIAALGPPSSPTTPSSPPSLSRAPSVTRLKSFTLHGGQWGGCKKKKKKWMWGHIMKNKVGGGGVRAPANESHLHTSNTVKRLSNFQGHTSNSTWHKHHINISEIRIH